MGRRESHAAMHTDPEPARWIARFAPLIRPGAAILDLAAGRGRHARWFLPRGHPVTAVDRDVSGLEDLRGQPQLALIEADLEGGPWPLPDRRFGAVIVTNYLWRPLFPRILGAGLIVCGAILVWNGLIARRAGAAWITIAPWARQPRRLATFLLVIALLLLYIFAAETVGFIPFALMFLVVLFLWLGVRPWIAAVTALASTLIVYWFFATMLRVPLPRGWLNSIL